MLGFYFGIGVLIFMFVGAIMQRSHEKQLWNSGLCAKGHKWASFDVDSQGGRGYVCRVCNPPYGKRIWISYRVDNA